MCPAPQSSRGVAFFLPDGVGMTGFSVIIWTKEEDLAIEECVKSGMTSGQIGKLLGRPASTIRNRMMKLRANGWQRPPESTVSYITPEEEELIIKMSDAGISYSVIADRIGRARSTVSNRLTQIRQRRKQAEAGISAAKSELVRCLGGCGKLFQSENRCTNRICNRCKRRHQEYSGGMDENFSIRL